MRGIQNFGSGLKRLAQDCTCLTHFVGSGLRGLLLVLSQWFTLCFMNVKLTVEYDGTDYHGWQIQRNGKTIKEVLEHALSEILREKVRVNGSGRTDAGVHA